MPTTKLLTPSIAVGWEDWTLPHPVFGYYLHRGRVYLCGALASKADGTTTQTLVDGMPAEARPAADTPLVLRVIPWWFFANKTLDWPRTLNATVHASDGSITLDDPLPAWANAPPDPSVWWRVTSPIDATPVALYPNALKLALSLGDLSWPSTAGASSDTFAHDGSLAPYLDAQFTDIDSWYSVHGTRIHLGGRIQATVDGATFVLDSLPPKTERALGTGSDSHDIQIDGWPFQVNPDFGLTIESDVVSPAGTPPYLSRTSEDRAPSNIWDNFTTAYVNGGTGYTGPSEDGPPLMDDIGDVARNDEATQAGQGQKFVRQMVDHLTMNCPQYAPDGTPTGLHFTCRQPGGATISLTFTLAELLAECNPAPDWFTVQAICDAGQYHGFLEAYHACLAPVLGGFSGGCADLRAVDIAPDWDGAVLKLGDGSASPTSFVAPGELGGTSVPPVYVMPPASLYNGDDPLATYGALPPDTHWHNVLWRADQAGGVGYTWTAEADCNAIDWSLGVILRPYYELRNDGVHDGDVITLDSSGWEGAITTQMWIA